MNQKLLKEIREELVKCKTEQDHLWKQTSIGKDLHIFTMQIIMVIQKIG